MAMEAQAVDAAFREAFDKLDSVRDSLLRLREMIEEKSDTENNSD